MLLRLLPCALLIAAATAPLPARAAEAPARPATPVFVPPGGTATPDPAPRDSREERRALGWADTDERSPIPAGRVLQPHLDARTAVWMSLYRPQDLPLPRLKTATGEVHIPLAADASLLRRVEAAEPGAEWRVRAWGDARGTAAAMHVDVEPFDENLWRNLAAREKARGIGSEAGMLAIMPRATMDHARVGRGSRFNRVPEPLEAPRKPEVRVTPLESGLLEDALVATADGKAWARVELAGDRPDLRWTLSTRQIFGGADRLLIAPRTIGTAAMTDLIAADPRTGAVTSLGRPAPPEAGTWIRVTDARDRGGVTEALVVVDESRPSGLDSTWGLLAVREGGAWTFPERYFTPVPEGLAWLRFDASDPDLLRLEVAETVATRPLRAAAPSP